MRTGGSGRPAARLRALARVGLCLLGVTLSGCVTRGDLLEQERKLSNMIEQQSKSVDAMRQELERIRVDAEGGRRPAPAPRTPAKPATPPRTPKDKTSKPALPATLPPPADPSAPIGMTLSPEGVSEEPPAGAVEPAAAAPAAAPAADGGTGSGDGTAMAATPPAESAPAPARTAAVADDPEWRREVAQERAVATATGGAERAEYIAALEGLEKGDCKRALARLKAVSGGAQGSLSDNAMYWQAKCLAARGDKRKAETRLNDVVARYPKSDKAPAALWEQAQLQLRSGDAAGARGTFSRLIRDYPASAEASRARKKVAELAN